MPVLENFMRQGHSVTRFRYESSIVNFICMKSSGRNIFDTHFYAQSKTLRVVK